ncbi:hypothetical protein A0H81_11304 [Grifola frondosa]|uniref:Uncharacterized protein n=1 Tax=Grifola frondosa TaxID=5627 RepID=A0A1C7LVF8_GRIFR|nr:hypothetical protein A0H81_11304 [Grifola frondosa]
MGIHSPKEIFTGLDLPTYFRDGQAIVVCGDDVMRDDGDGSQNRELSLLGSWLRIITPDVFFRCSGDLRSILTSSIFSIGPGPLESSSKKDKSKPGTASAVTVNESSACHSGDLLSQNVSMVPNNAEFATTKPVVLYVWRVPIYKCTFVCDVSFVT